MATTGRQKREKSTHRLTGESPGRRTPRNIPDGLPKATGRGENHYLRNIRTSRLPRRRERNHRKAQKSPKPRKVPERDFSQVCKGAETIDVRTMTLVLVSRHTSPAGRWERAPNQLPSAITNRRQARCASSTGNFKPETHVLAYLARTQALQPLPTPTSSTSWHSWTHHHPTTPPASYRVTSPHGRRIGGAGIGTDAVCTVGTPDGRYKRL